MLSIQKSSLEIDMIVFSENIVNYSVFNITILPKSSKIQTSSQIFRANHLPRYLIKLIRR